jgi:hypothetical protein
MIVKVVEHDPPKSLALIPLIATVAEAEGPILTLNVVADVVPEVI